MSVRPMPTVASSLGRLLVGGMLSGVILNAQAARPLLATEEADTNPPNNCFVEIWHNKTDASGNQHLNTVCGVVPGLELGFEMARTRPTTTYGQAGTLSLKWAPEWLAWQDWRWGVMGQVGAEKAYHDDWRHASEALSILATRNFAETWTLHINLGRGHRKLDKHHDTPYSVALLWAPQPTWLLFGEVNGLNHSSAMQTLGVRYWVIPNKLGLDLSRSHVNAQPQTQGWGIGLGLYNLEF